MYTVKTTRKMRKTMFPRAKVWFILKTRDRDWRLIKRIRVVKKRNKSRRLTFYYLGYKR